MTFSLTGDQKVVGSGVPLGNLDIFLSKNSSKNIIINKVQYITRSPLIALMLLLVFHSDPAFRIVFTLQMRHYMQTTQHYTESANCLQDKLNHDLVSVTNWLRSNKLTLNTSKSKFMLVGSRRRLGAFQSIEIQ